MRPSFSTLALLAAATLAARASAHSNMILPLSTWSAGWSTNSFAATIEGDKDLPVPDDASVANTSTTPSTDECSVRRRQN
ncbi:hypothetical protein PHYPSEUDO_011999 [Phytophthora pseudosyringae]|uniref:RxLR effector protein n=1 Tax=Phytophthora pseudosyringae TaxID=221518 RepID=A0A8T1W418_9STRA|nr:hypothetical protein PHYPSEUDO_011999 [Phytophthora pseudosyringae]